MLGTKWKRSLILVGAGGIILYVLTDVLAHYAVFPTILPNDDNARFPRSLRELAIALVIATVVAFASERLVHEALLLEVEKLHRAIQHAVMQLSQELLGGAGRLNESLLAELRTRHSAILKEVERMVTQGLSVQDGAINLRVDDIVTRRAECKERCAELMARALQQQLDRKHGEILVACVAAPAIFRTDTQLGMLLSDGLAAPGSQCVLRVLLLCPESDACSLRQNLEEPHPTRNDVDSCARYLRKLSKQCGDRICVRYHDDLPSAFLLITDDLLFLEPYPLYETDGVAMGGLTPMLVIRSSSKTYEIWKRHVNYAWRSPHSHEVARHAATP